MNEHDQNPTCFLVHHHARINTKNLNENIENEHEMLGFEHRTRVVVTFQN
jgi:hypothetical protein